MLLAISGLKLFILYLAALAAIVFFFIRRFVKKNSNAKRNREDRYNELNTFILQYEASKKVEAGKGKNEEQIKEEQKEAASEDVKQTDEQKKPVKIELNAETIGRIKALYFDAEVSVEKIAEKTGVSIEHIESLIKN